MPNKKSLICLANSRKLNGRCFAGKEKHGSKILGWVRPVGRSSSGELSIVQLRCQEGRIPQHLDVVQVPVVEHSPQSYQTENYLVDESCSWTIEGTYSKTDLSKLCDDVERLWMNGYSSYNGLNDRIPQRIAQDQIEESLVLIQPQSLTLSIGPELYHRKVRALFEYRGESYRLVITDIVVEEHLRQMADGEYDIDPDGLYVCVSLGEPYSGYVYKLVAGLINYKGI